jgi:hypothetical protein
MAVQTTPGLALICSQQMTAANTATAAATAAMVVAAILPQLLPLQTACAALQAAGCAEHAAARGPAAAETAEERLARVALNRLAEPGDVRVAGLVAEIGAVRLHRLLADERGPDGLSFRGDSDAHIVRGLIALLLRLYSGRTAEEIVAFDAKAGLARLGLSGALSAQRSNGLFSMVERIRRDAAAS